jgi:uncharacterized membrane protein
MFGIPVALGGALYYALVFVLLAFYTRTGTSRPLHGVVFLTGVGFLATLWFVYVQLFVLNSICVYCMVSAAATTLLLVGSIYLMKAGEATSDR